MLYISFDTEKVNVLGQSTKRVIAEDGSLVAVSLFSEFIYFLKTIHLL